MKNLLQEVMIKSDKKKKPEFQGAIFNIDGLIEKIQSGYLVGREGKYTKKKTFAPSSLLFYVGFDKKIENVEHHSLFFDVDFDIHAEAIYDNPKWPEEPLFYASFPSKKDENCAPEGKETGIFFYFMPTNYFLYIYVVS